MLQLKQLGPSILGNKKNNLFSVSIVKNKPVMIAQNCQLEKNFFNVLFSGKFIQMLCVTALKCHKNYIWTR